MTALNTMNLVCHLSVRWSWTLNQSVFFLWAFCFFFFARPRRFGEKKVTRNIEKKAHGLTPRVQACLALVQTNTSDTHPQTSLSNTSMHYETLQLQFTGPQHQLNAGMRFAPTPWRGSEFLPRRGTRAISVSSRPCLSLDFHLFYVHKKNLYVV